MNISARDKEGGGLRERKKRETRKRITEMGIALFLKNGFDQTTLDEIAAADEPRPYPTGMSEDASIVTPVGEAPRTAHAARKPRANRSWSASTPLFRTISWIVRS